MESYADKVARLSTELTFQRMTFMTLCLAQDKKLIASAKATEIECELNALRAKKLEEDAAVQQHAMSVPLRSNRRHTDRSVFYPGRPPVTKPIRPRANSTSTVSKKVLTTLSTPDLHTLPVKASSNMVPKVSNTSSPRKLRQPLAIVYRTPSHSTPANTIAAEMPDSLSPPKDYKESYATLKTQSPVKRALRSPIVFPPPQKRLTIERPSSLLTTESRQSECAVPITPDSPLVATVKRELNLQDPIEAARTVELDAYAEYARIKATAAQIEAQQHRDLAALDEQRRKIVQDARFKTDECRRDGLTAYNTHVDAKTQREKLEHESKIMNLC